MRAVWILLGLVLVAAVIWWLSSGSSGDGEEGLVADDPAAHEPGPALLGRGEALVADGAAEVSQGAVSIRGSVEDTEGKLLAGVGVRLEQYVEPVFIEERQGAWLDPERIGRPEPYRHVAETRTAEDGGFSFRGLAPSLGGYRVRTVAEPPWFQAIRHAGLQGRSSFIRLVVGQGLPLRVRVVDARGLGVAAYISGYREREGADWHPASFEGVATDADGRATLYLPDGAFNCSVDVPGVGSRYGVLVETPQSREVLVAVGIRGGATVAGRVSDTAGRPIRGAHVLASSIQGSEASLSRLATTGADGTYRIDCLLAGTLREVSLTAAGFVTVDTATPQRALVAGAEIRVDVTMLRGGVIEGTVWGPDGRVVSGARVQARAQRARGPLAGRDCAVTDAAGRYRMTQVPPGEGTVRVSAPGVYQPESSKGWYVIEAEAQHKVVDITLARGIPVTGQVVDSADRPVAGASVNANGRASQGWWRHDWPARNTLTDAEGRFTYPGLPPSRRWRLTARTETSLSQAVDVVTVADASPPPPVKIVLRPGAVVEGRVVASDGALHKGLRVHARGKGADNKTTSVLADGTFRIAGLQPGDFDVYVVDWNFSRISQSAQVQLTWGQLERDVELELERLGRIAGVVVDQGGEPVPGLRIVLDISTPGHSRTLSAETNLRGRFEFSNVPASGHTFTIRIGEERQPGACKPGDTDLRFVVEPPETVRFEGTVRLPDGSAALAGRVTIWDVSPEGGRHGLGISIYDGTFGQTLQRRSPNSTFAAEVREVFDVLGRTISIQPMVLDGVEPGTPIEFRLVAGLEIEGVVLDADGAPVSGVRVSIAPKGERLGLRHKNMKSREDGSFQFGSLQPGRMEVRVGGVSPPWIAPPSVDVHAGTKDVRIQLLRGGAIRGTVLAPDGEPLAGASVSWGRLHAREVAGLSDELGAFELSPVPPGAVGTVTASPPARADVPMVQATVEGVRAGADGLELRLQPGAWVRGEVTGPGGEVVPNGWVMCTPASKPGQPVALVRLDGTKQFQLGPVPPGRYTLRVGAGGEYVPPDPIEVDAPTDAVRIVVPKGTTIKGTLTGTDRPERFAVMFVHMTADGPHTMGGSVTPSGQFLVTLKNEDVGTLFFREHDGGDLYALVENVRPSAAPLTVELEQGLTIEGRFEPYAEGEQGYVYIQAVSGLNLNAQVAKDGTFVVRGVPPGAWDVHGFVAGQRMAPLKGVRAGTKGHVLRKP